MRKLMTLVGLGVAAAVAGSALAQATFPTAPVREVRDTYFGTVVTDPYRWLEDATAPEAQRWMRQAADHASTTLAAIPGRDRLLARIAELESGAPAEVGRVIRLPGPIYVYELRGAADNQFRIVMRRGLTGAIEVLVDPNALTAARGGVPVAVNYFSASPDGRYLAYGVSERGSEAAVLHVLDTQTGRAVGEPITRADDGVARWSPDGRSFTFNRLREDNGDRLRKYEGSAVWLLRVGDSVAEAKQLLGPATRSVQVRPSETPTVLFTADGRWLIGLLEDGVRRDVRVVVAPAASLRDAEPAWSVRIDNDDRVVDFAYARGMLYASTHRDAPRYRIVADKIETFNAATAPTVVPASDRVLGNLVAARDALYFDARAGNAKQLWRLPYATPATAEQVPLPLAGTFSLRSRGGVWAAHEEIDGVLIALQDWARAPQIYEISARGEASNTGLQPKGPFDAPTDVVTTEALVTSHDGARVPLSIIHRRGLRLDGRNPTLLLGYGAYGFTWEPRFVAHRQAWIEQGGVIAVANPRGSGVFGQAWYEAGKKATKPNTWRDMIASAEYLIAAGYAQPATLAIEGRSAGGITSGRAATERPDLFVAVVPVVGVLDMVHAELEPNGPPNIPEFGSHKSEDGFKALLAMSTYHHIKEGVRYPAVLLPHGVTDPRVAVWHSAKTAARFAAVAAGTPDARPVLLRLDYDAGHGVGSTKRQRQQEAADIYAFLLWQMGVAGFQPGK